LLNAEPDWQSSQKLLRPSYFTPSIPMVSKITRLLTGVARSYQERNGLPIFGYGMYVLVVPGSSCVTDQFPSPFSFAIDKDTSRRIP
jgi:hypothetical protein